MIKTAIDLPEDLKEQIEKTAERERGLGDARMAEAPRILSQVVPAAARHIVEKYRKLRLGLADIVVFASQYGTSDVLTLDERHFGAIRPSGRRSFRTRPADR